jgi:cysteine synthase A
LSLYDSVADRIDPNIGLIESTSGNLGVALASIARSQGIPFTAVVDPRTPSSAMRALRRLGSTVITATEQDSRGGFLLTRLQLVRKALREQPGLCWTNQYENPANPRAHEFGTAPELAEQVDNRSVVMVAVSTGGTLAGIRAYAARGTDWTVIGVDVLGSHALSGSTGARVLPGIGSSRRSSFVTRDAGPAVFVDSEAVASACVWLLEQSGIGVGASSGALVAAALRLIEQEETKVVVCICPDGADSYLNTVYSSAWRSANNLTVRPIPATVQSVDWEAY